MKKDKNRERLYDLLKDIDELNARIDRCLNESLTIPQARKRDYIVRTKYYGKIKDTNIKNDFKEDIEHRLRNTFDGICNSILNYEFAFDDGIYQCQDILETYYKALEQYEYKQIILDTYKK